MIEDCTVSVKAAIEWLVHSEKVDIRAASRDLLVKGSSRNFKASHGWKGKDQVLAMMQLGGVVIDRAGYDMGPCEDAEALFGMIVYCGFSRFQLNLLWNAAQNRDVPDHIIFKEMTCEPIGWKRGIGGHMTAETKVLRKYWTDDRPPPSRTARRTRRNKRFVKEEVCPVEIFPSYEAMSQAQGEYREWINCLERIRDQIWDEDAYDFKKLDVTFELPDPEPWGVSFPAATIAPIGLQNEVPHRPTVPMIAERQRRNPAQ